MTTEQETGAEIVSIRTDITSIRVHVEMVDQMNGTLARQLAEIADRHFGLKYASMTPVGLIVALQRKYDKAVDGLLRGQEER